MLQLIITVCDDCSSPVKVATDQAHLAHLCESCLAHLDAEIDAALAENEWVDLDGNPVVVEFVDLPF